LLHAVGYGHGFLTARGYRAAKARPPPDQAIRYEMLIADLRTVHQQNFAGYGSRSCHAAAGLAERPRTDPAVGGSPRKAQRGKPVFTTIADPAAATPADLVDRRFTQPVVGGGHHLMGPGPGLTTPRLSPTRPPKRSSAGRVAATMRTEDLPLRAFNHAVWQADSDLSELAHQYDRGSPPLPATPRPPLRHYRFPKPLSVLSPCQRRPTGRRHRRRTRPIRLAPSYPTTTPHRRGVATAD
jgi:putative transposase